MPLLDPGKEPIDRNTVSGRGANNKSPWPKIDTSPGDITAKAYGTAYEKINHKVTTGGDESRISINDQSQFKPTPKAAKNELSVLNVKKKSTVSDKESFANTSVVRPALSSVLNETRNISHQKMAKMS